MQRRHHLFTYILMCVCLIAVSLLPVTACAAGDKLSGGWRNPLGPDGGTMSIITKGTFNNDSYYSSYSQAHGGVDMFYNTGTARNEEPVYSIGDGVVDFIRKVSDSTYNDSVIHVKYTAADGTSFKATYGHTYAVSGLAVGDTVTRGQQIGTTRHWNSYHLHFAVVWNRQKTPSGWGGLNADLLGDSTSTDARLALLHTYGWWEPFEFLAAHPYEETYDRAPFYGAVVVPMEAEFYEKPDMTTGTGDYAERSDVLSVYGKVTDADGNVWYALSREDGYYLSANDVDVYMTFDGEPVKVNLLDSSSAADALSARVGEVLYVYATIDESTTNGLFNLENATLTCDNTDIAEFDSTNGGRLVIKGTGTTLISIRCTVVSLFGERTSWCYEVPLTVSGSSDVGNTTTYEVLNSSGLRIREKPTTSSTTVIVMPCGSLFTADNDNQVEADGYTWAYVTAETGETGWAAISNSSYCTPVTGYTLVQAGTGSNRHRYIVYKGEGTWTDAEDFVNSLGDGWHLATITSAGEQATVSRLVSAYGGTCWIGGQYSGGWTWVTGEEFSYTNWDDGEPSGNSSEPYLGIYGNSTQTSYATTGKWNDFKSSTSTVNGFVAEKDAPREITFAHDAMLAYIGEEAYVNARVNPALEVGEKLTYTVTDPAILSVDANGSITGHSAGVTEIVVADQYGITGRVRVYVFDKCPVTITPYDLNIFMNYSRDLIPEWVNQAQIREHLSHFEVVDSYTDGDLVSCDGNLTFTGLKKGITNLYFDIVYRTVDGETLYGDTLLMPVVVGEIFTPEREHYECAVGDEIRILYELSGEYHENDLQLYWEGPEDGIVEIDQEGRLKVKAVGYPSITVYATWANIIVGFIDLDVCEYDTAVLPDDLTILEEDALRGINVERIDARGTALQRIESGAMAGIGNLRSVCLDASVKYIAPDAFEGSSLIWIHCPEGSYAHQWALDNGYYPNVW